MVNSERLMNDAMSLVVGEMIMADEARRRLVVVMITIVVGCLLIGRSLFLDEDDMLCLNLFESREVTILLFYHIYLSYSKTFIRGLLAQALPHEQVSLVIRSNPIIAEYPFTRARKNNHSLPINYRLHRVRNN